MRELKRNELIEATDLLQCPEPVKYHGEWLTLLPANGVQSGRIPNGFVGELVGESQLHVRGNACIWMRPNKH